jgi:hypothetical protein
MKFVFVAAAAVLAAGPAFAQSTSMGATAGGSGAALSDQADLPSGPTTAANGNGEHLICRRIPTDSSSHMGSRRVCLSAEGWRQAQRSNN